MNDLLASELLAEVLNRNAQTQGLGCNSPKPFDENSFLERICESVQNVFSKMCQLSVIPTVKLPGCPVSRNEISGVINISGPATITVVVNVSPSLAFTVAKTLTGVSTDRIDSDVLDVVGELANMVAGSAKEYFCDKSIVLGLPTVISGPAHHLGFRTSMNRWVLYFDCEIGDLQIELGIANN